MGKIRHRDQRDQNLADAKCAEEITSPKLDLESRPAVQTSLFGRLRLLNAQLPMVSSHTQLMQALGFHSDRLLHTQKLLRKLLP